MPDPESATCTRVVAGELAYETLALNEWKKNRPRYEMKKILIWHDLLKQWKRPTKWHKPTESHTKVHFTTMDSISDYEVALEELNEYIQWTKQFYDLHITLQ